MKSYAVLGLGRFGKQLALSLARQGAEVLAIDRNRKNVDEVAYVRFACVYRQFQDIHTFMDELKRLIEDK